MVESLAQNAILSEEVVVTLNTTYDADEVKKMLAAALGIDGREDYTEGQREVIVDFFFYCFAFTKEAGFTPLKACTFLSIVKVVLDNDQAVPESGPAGDAIKASFESFKALVLSHGVERPPHSAGVFCVDDVSRIVEYMLNAYFRHHKLYRYLFTSRLHTSLVQTNPHGVEEFQLPARPLNEALPRAIELAEVEQPAVPPEPPVGGDEEGLEGGDDEEAEDGEGEGGEDEEET